MYAAGVLWKRGVEGWMKTRGQMVGVAVWSSGEEVCGGGIKYLIVLASASSSLVPVRDCMYFLEGRLIVAI